MRYKDNCGNWAINIDKLEFAIKMMFIEKFIDLVEIDLKEIDKEEIGIQSFEKELKAIEGKGNKLLDAFLDGLIPKLIFADKQIKLKKEADKIRKMITESKSKIEEIRKLKNITKNGKIQIDMVKGFFKKNPETKQYEMTDLQINKEYIRQVIKEIIVTKDNTKLTQNKQDKTVKVEIVSIADNVITIYLSQRAKFFLYNDKKIEYPHTKPLIKGVMC